MKKSILFLLVTALFLLTSCAKSLTVNYQKSDENTGSITIIPTRPTSRTYVMLNGKLLVKNENVEQLTIKNVPEGQCQLQYVSDDSDCARNQDSNIKINVLKDKEQNMLIAVPVDRNDYWEFWSSLATASYVALVFTYFTNK